tara:strand:+ start:1603 stop:2427 length:825 start_codon:yes stop_codon:yes gene_type:complete
MIRIVDIQGGFGNQLFQYAFALNLMKKGFKVFTYFGKEYQKGKKNKSYSEERQIIIDSKEFGIKKLNTITYFFLEFFKRIPYFNNRYYKIIFEKDFDNQKKYNYITSFNGFWQDIVTVENSLDEIKKVFLNKKYLSKAEKSRTLVQVRRGDFVSFNNDLKIEFYESALLKINKIIEEIDFDVVTDDVEWVKNNSIFSNAKNIFPPSDDRNEVLNLFKRMLTYKNFIVGNSTFTLWAALISSDKNSKVIIDEKFSYQLNMNESKLFSDWIIVKNS